MLTTSNPSYKDAILIIFNKFAQFISTSTQSLKARLMLSALFMIIVMLPIIGITLSNAFTDQLTRALENELRAYGYSIFSVSEVENNQLIMPEQLLENQFNVIQSGLYAQITTISKKINIKKNSQKNLSKSQEYQLEGSQLEAHQLNHSQSEHSQSVHFQHEHFQLKHTANILWQSASLLGIYLTNRVPSPDIGSYSFTEMLIENEPHMVYSISVSFGELENAFPVTLHIFKNQAEFLATTNGFQRQLWIWLVLLIIIFIIAQFIWLKWTLKPLDTLTLELEQVQQGKQNSLNKIYPDELKQVTTQLNTLLNTDRSQRKRYRNALSDLAHSLKAPLTVIQSQTNLPQETKEQISNISYMVEHQLKRAQSAGESAWHLGVSIEPICTKLINTLNKIYRDKQLDISVNIQQKSLFKGDEADLMEILGNLLDNACKAANKKIECYISFNAHCLRMTIADDGQGIKETQRKAILERGTRADTYDKGHGIGLAIVRDLVNSYNGELNIQQSSALGGALFVLTFHLSK